MSVKLPQSDHVATKGDCYQIIDWADPAHPLPRLSLPMIPDNTQKRLNRIFPWNKVPHKE